MEIIFNSFVIVALTEMGDKTQLLAFLLASRFKKPWTILAGILIATILNHLLAAWAGELLTKYIPMEVLTWILAISFFGFAFWVLIPDKDDGLKEHRGWGAFLTTLVAFFLAEMGDKTQLATTAMAAKYQSTFFVTIGSTLGMMLTSALAVIFGDKLTQKISMKWIHRCASVFYVVLGIIIIYQFYFKGMPWN